MILSHQDIFTLFAILVLGCALGRARIRSFSFGSAGVLIVALLFGHYGVRIPSGILDLGLLLFVYAAGLQAGPRFFRTFKRSRIHYLTLGVIPVVVSFLAAIVVGRYFHLSRELILGVFSGALTDTTSLVAAIDAMEKTGLQHSSDVSIGFTIAYPFSVFSVILLMQVLPRFLKADLEDAEVKWHAQKAFEDPPVLVKQFKVTNPNCHGKTIRQLNPRKRNTINISYVHREDLSMPANPNLELRLGDILTIVASAQEFESIEVLIGEEVQTPLELGKNILVLDVDVSAHSLTGRTLAELRVFQNHSVIITHIRRQGMEFVAQATSTLDIGDNIRVAGDPEHVRAFSNYAGPRESLMDETNMLPFLSGLFLGIIVGSIPLKIGSDVQIELGLAGGAFLVSLLMGHFGKVGKFSLYVPQASKNLCRELGLMLFLASAGTYTGSGMQDIVTNYGFGIFIAGAIVTLTFVVASLLCAHSLFKLNILSTMGIICGSMANSPGLGIVKERSESDLPALSYATIYPVSLIVKIIAAQILVLILNYT